MKHDKIPTSEIKQDIADTLTEIADLERKEKGYELLGDKLSYFKACSCRSGIVERKEFIKKLESILSERAQNEIT